MARPLAARRHIGIGIGVGLEGQRSLDALNARVPRVRTARDISQVTVASEPTLVPRLRVLLEGLAQPVRSARDSGAIELSGEPLARLVELIRPGRLEGPEVAVGRFRGLIDLITADPALAEALAAYLRAVLLSRMHRTLYADSGVLTSQGFFTGIWSRLLGGLLPPAVDPDFLRDLVAEVFDGKGDAAWVAALPRELWYALFDRLGVSSEAFAPVRAHARHELFEALRICSHRLAALGMEPAMLRYAPALARHESPFLAQSDEVRLFIAAHGAEAEPTRHDGHLEVLLGHCTQMVTRIRKLSRESGVGVDLVFVLARIEQLVERMRLLRILVLPQPGDERATAKDRALEFLVRIVRFESRRHRFGALFEGTTQLLARRVTEQASKSGEHYVTETRAEFVAIFRAAAGAGLLVGLMALLKILAAKLGLPAFWEAVAFSLVYGLGFVLVHILHLTIATKQPAMTAATLAASLDASKDREARLDGIAELAAQVSRTQWISIAGNVSIGFLTALFLALMGRLLFDWQPVTPAKGTLLLGELHPWRSLALFHAAIAGVYLFLSGLISGYYDNQSLYHRIPARIRRVKFLRRTLGPERLARVAQYVEHNLGALAGNFLFGVMLGSTGVLGRFFGLPVDIRHVSFASANLAYAWQALDFALDWRTVAVAAAGVVLIGLVNLVVSFWLALKVALRSRGITRGDTEGLTARVFARLRARPMDFFWPPRG